MDLRDPYLDDETAANLQMMSGVTEVRNLFVLGSQIHDRVAYEIDEIEGPVDPGGGEVSDRRPHSPPGLVRSSAIMAGDKSIPCTRMSRWLSGSARHPVPIPSSRTALVPARSARNPTAGSTTAGSKISGHLVSQPFAMPCQNSLGHKAAHCQEHPRHSFSDLGRRTPTGVASLDSPL